MMNDGERVKLVVEAFNKVYQAGMNHAEKNGERYFPDLVQFMNALDRADPMRPVFADLIESVTDLLDMVENYAGDPSLDQWAATKKARNNLAKAADIIKDQLAHP